jgi:hypothetical protein
MIRFTWFFILACFSIGCLSVWTMTFFLILDAILVNWQLQMTELLLLLMFIVCSIGGTTIPFHICSAMKLDLLRRKNGKFKSSF